MNDISTPEAANDINFGGLITNANFVGDDLIAEIENAYEKKGGLLAHRFNEQSGMLPGSAFSVLYVSDNGGLDEDLAKAEIKGRFLDFRAKISALAEQSPPEYAYADAPAQDSLAGAYDLAQLARDSERGPGKVLFLNCAPRKRQRGNGEDNQGESVYVGMMESGTVVAAVGEESFTFFKDLIDRGELELFEANVQTKGSQFRSRDYFPLYSLVLTHQLRQKAEEGEWKSGLSLEDRRELLSSVGAVNTDKIMDVEHIPDLSEQLRVVRVDTHGNLKLNLRVKDLPGELFEEPVEISINGQKEVMQFGKSMFDQGGKRFSFSNGSTGSWDDFKRANPTDDGVSWSSDPDGFLQIAYIGGSAAEHFRLDKFSLRSDDGVQVSITPLEGEGRESQPAVVHDADGGGKSEMAARL